MEKATKKQVRQDEIVRFFAENPNHTSSDVWKGLDREYGIATIKRDLSELTDKGILIREGSSVGTTYFVNPLSRLFIPYSISMYFLDEVDKRTIHERFDIDLIRTIVDVESLFTNKEMESLEALQKKFTQKLNDKSDTLKKKNFETLAIDLIWKSSQIEGNTYSLLETETLVKESKEAMGKSREEAIMILNHKKAIDYIMERPNDITPIRRLKIERLHELLIQDLGVERGLRNGLVRITGTNYRPLENMFQIEEAIDAMCDAINARKNVFEKALLAVLFISYIQPFEDGNKRTARIVSNALLMSKGYCPISYKTVESENYKKAVLLFYEQNSIIAFKEIFIEQFDYAVNNYF